MKKYVISLLFIIFIVVLTSVASAIDWSPQGNITLKNRYYILNNPAGSCSGTDVVVGVSADGTWNCSSATGDITGVLTPGNYLTGGCTSGTCTLTVVQSYLNGTIDTRSAVFNASMKVYVDGKDSSYNTSIKNYLDGKDVAFNSSMKVYVDGKDVSYNSSMATYVTDVNGTMKDYVDGKDVTFNSSIVTWINSLGFKTLTEIVASVGNWTLDKTSYYTSTIIDTLGNWSADKGDYYTSTQTDTAITNGNVNSSTWWDNENSQADLNVNHSTTSGTATTWDGETLQTDLNVNHSDTTTTWDSETSQGDLNVNSSDNWDGLGSINASQFENDGGVLHLLDSWLQSIFFTETETISTFVNRTEWTTNDDYPTACSGATPNVQGIGDTLTCRKDASNTSEEMVSAIASAGFFSDIENFTGTLTNGKICTYDSGTGEINCTTEASAWTYSDYFDQNLNESDNITAAYFCNSTDCYLLADFIIDTDTNTQLSQEEVEDYAGGMWTGNTESGVDVVYQDDDGTIDVTFDCSDVAGDGLNCDGEDLVFECSDIAGTGLSCFDSNMILSLTPTVTTIDTGEGANELFDMDQNVLTTSDVTFNKITSSDWSDVDGLNETQITLYHEKCFTLESPTDSDDDVPVWSPTAAITITDVYCRVQGGTSAAITLGDGTNYLEAITCDADGQADDGSIANAGFDANERMEFDTGTVTGEVDWVNYCLTYTVD